MDRKPHRWSRFSVALQWFFVRIGVLPILLVIALVVFAALSSRFLTSENLITVARQATYLAIVSMGQMLALLTGGFDLSVGKIVAVTSVVTALTMAPLAAAHPDATAITLTLGILAGVGAGIRAGEVALREPRHRRKHVPCESGLLRDTDVETHFLDDGDITIFRPSLDAQHASEIGDGSNDKADAGAAAALKHTDLHPLCGLLRIGRDVGRNEHTRGDGTKDGRTAH